MKYLYSNTKHMRIIFFTFYFFIFIVSTSHAQATTTSTTNKYVITENGTTLVRVTIQPGLRKEEIANILSKELGWTKAKKEKFLRYTTLKYNELEGVYFPETYLIPQNEEPALVQKRLVNKWNENFSPYLKQLNSQNFPWLKALTLASIVEREAASKEDMPLIAGILLNRLEKKIPLQVDATLQYVRGDKNKNVKNSTTTAFWAPISVSDKKLTSKFNTYKNTGLPPHPISNPSLAAIQSVVNPATTSCLYYIHKNKVTYCANTYNEHLDNINKYLKATSTNQ